jgi:cytochrome c peroxidase
MRFKLGWAARSSVSIGCVLMAVGCQGNEAETDVAPVDYRSGIEALGAQIFNDTNLSTPPGEACATCHSPAQAFTDSRPGSATSQGAIAGRFGFRNTPSAADPVQSVSV